MEENISLHCGVGVRALDTWMESVKKQASFLYNWPGSQCVPACWLGEVLKRGNLSEDTAGALQVNSVSLSWSTIPTMHRRALQQGLVFVKGHLWEQSEGNSLWANPGLKHDTCGRQSPSAVTVLWFHPNRPNDLHRHTLIEYVPVTKLIKKTDVYVPLLPWTSALQSILLNPICIGNTHKQVKWKSVIIVPQNCAVYSS